MKAAEPESQDASWYLERIEAGDWDGVLERDEARFRAVARRASLRFRSLTVADHEDIVQNTMCQIYQARHTFDSQKAGYKWWSHKICTNEIFKLLREKKRNGQLTAAPPHASGETPGGWESQVKMGHAAPNINKVEYHVTTTLRVREALQRLTEDEQRLLVRSYCEGLTDEELAQLYGIGISAMTKRIYRAALKLKALLREGDTALRESVATQ